MIEKDLKVNKKCDKIIKVLPLTSDFVFKSIFSNKENKDIIMYFLECVLQIKIEDVLIENTELLKNHEDVKEGYLDVLILANNTNIINIEMQNQNTPYYEMRSMFYWAKVFLQQFGKEFDYTKAKKVIRINIVNFHDFNRDTYHTIEKGRLEEIDVSKNIRT